ncbi:SDR family oxidoreductase [Kushneria phosphatilytica]|uniref:SDR family oxidoreductase n=1 Tax=Kushneria phosphatilytica TaxID=657387 RepID=A0A1S1NSF6_9GAMM|nr:SDR family oxidoreductase [Kushneria phosphatilytica]OHV08954.1 NAD(P)-dependent oxidoreductase [Kushneria phosphatilytica]QEL09718.1 SDR family oxidoreductase [Kushneria phosphatilytica]
MSEQIPPQQQDRQPGVEGEMTPPAEFIRDDYQGSGKLRGRVAIVTGGDSGIGRAVALHFAREGADVVIPYLDEHEDASETKRRVEAEGRHCLLLDGDLSQAAFCRDVVARTIDQFDRLDVLVNNAARQELHDDPEATSDEEWLTTFDVNIHAYFYMAKAALPHLRRSGGTIINSTSVNAYAGHPKLLAYTTTKGAISGFTRALSQMTVGDGVRVNQVAPGPIWTPLIPSTMGQFDTDMVEDFGAQSPMGRAGQPSELGPAYVYLASRDSSYVSGQTIHVNGGMIVNG